MIIYVNNKVDCYFDHVGFLTYDGSFEATIVEQLPYQGDRNADNAWRFLQRLCEQRTVILLIDDIRKKQSDISLGTDDSFEKLSTINTSVLLASRTLTKGFDTKPIQNLATEECVRIFQAQRYPDKNHGDVTSLSEANADLLIDIIKNYAGLNPLIINRLGAMTGLYGWSIAKLQTKLDDNDFNLAKGFDSSEKLQEEINKLYSVNNIESYAERNVLEAFAILPDIPLPQELCHILLQKDSGVEDDDEFTKILLKLSNSTWLTVFVDEKRDHNVYSMHQMVRTALLTQIDKITFDEHCALCSSSEDYLAFHIKKQNITIIQPFITFTEALSEFFLKQDAYNIIKLRFLIGEYYFLSSSFHKALEWSKENLEVFKKMLKPDDPQIGSTIFILGLIYSFMCDFSYSLEYFFKFLEFKTMFSKDDYSEILMTYRNIANSYENSGNYNKQLEYLQKAVAIEEEKQKHQDQNSDNNSELYRDIAMAYANLKNHEEMLVWLQKAYDASRDTHGMDNPKTMTIYANLLFEQHNYSEALEWYQKALSYYEEESSMRYTDIESIFNGIARILCIQYNYHAAIEILQSELDIVKDKYGENSKFTSNVYSQIGKTLTCMGDYSLALKQYRKALSIREYILGVKHPHTALTYNKIADVYFYKGNLHECLTWRYKALHSYEACLAFEDPLIENVKKSINYNEKIMRNPLRKYLIQLGMLIAWWLHSLLNKTGAQNESHRYISNSSC